VLQNGSYRVCAHQLGDAVRRDAESDALVRELEDLPDGGERVTDADRLGEEFADSFTRTREDSQDERVNQPGIFPGTD
jgi:hypothetical protein